MSHNVADYALAEIGAAGLVTRGRLRAESVARRIPLLDLLAAASRAGVSVDPDRSTPTGPDPARRATALPGQVPESRPPWEDPERAPVGELPPPDLTLEGIFRLALDGGEPSALQLAICHAASGLACPDLGDLAPHFGSTSLEATRPTFVALIAGVRGGKSFLAAAAAISGAFSADCSRLTKREVPRFAIVAPSRDLARATYTILRGIVESHPWLVSRLDGKPTADRLRLRRLDGRIVEVCVVAAAVGGQTVRARWLAGYVLDECAHFGRETDGAVVTAESLQDAAGKRLLGGAQGWLISSPYGPSGLLYDVYTREFGKPGRWLVVRAPTRALNPTFPLETVEAAKLENPDGAAREYDAEWTDAEASLLSSADVDACSTRVGDAARLEGAVYVACMDPAGGRGGNAWTLAIACHTAERGVVIACCREWVGSRTAPLDLAATLREIKRVAWSYGVHVVETDRWSAEFLIALARQEGLSVSQWPGSAGEDFQLADSLRTALAVRRVELPVDAHVRADLLACRRYLTPSGVSLRLPTTADGRHCDYVPSITRAHQRALGTAAWRAPEERDERQVMERNLLDQEARRAAARKGQPWRRFGS